MEKLLIVLLVATSYTYASKMCAGDDDCVDLGDVFCMKSRCNWGLCGCPRGQAMRFLGSEKKFQCVPIRRVGESCSTDGDAGVCGAQYSKCIDGSCQCDVDTSTGGKTYSYWGGERCASQSPLQSASGETCSASLGTCGLHGGNSAGCMTGNNWWTGGIDSPLDTLPNTCGCSTGYRVALENDFEDHAFTGKTIPRCEPIKFDELCLLDDDCPGGAGAGTTRMHCVDNKCACFTPGYKPNLASTRCDTPLGKGVRCAGPNWDGNGHCDGTIGLVCGDVCDLAKYNAAPPVDLSCICDHSYTDSSPCQKVAEDSSCDVDYQCKSLSRTAVCVEGLCKAGAGMVIGSLFTILVTVMFTLQEIA